MSYNIIFFDRHSILVSDERAEKVKVLIKAKAHSFEIGKSLYVISSITRIVPVKHTEANVGFPQLNATGQNTVTKETLEKINQQVRQKYN